MEAEGRKIMVGDNKSLDKQIKASEHNTLTLFSVYQKPPSPTLISNPNISCVVEKVSQHPQVKTGKDYLDQSKPLLRQSQMPYTFTKPMYTEVVGGTTFDVMPADINVGILSLQQNFYAARKKDYIFLLVLSFTNPAEEAELKRILATTKLK